MSSEMATTPNWATPTREVDSWVHVLGPVGDLANRISATEFVPKALRGRPAAAAGAILAGRERGLGPMVALASIDIIEGRPQLSAQLLAALIFRAGHRIKVGENSDKACEVTIERSDGLAEHTVRWTMTDAQRAGLAGKANWQKHPRQMLHARALSECARITCPDVALGLDSDGGVEPEPAHVEVVRVVEPPPHLVPPDGGALDVEPPPDLPDPRITGPQMRKIGALLTHWQQQNRALDREERRSMIAALAGVEHLASASDLTVTEASAAIDALEALLNGDEAAGEDDDQEDPHDEHDLGGEG